MTRRLLPLFAVAAVNSACATLTASGSADLLVKSRPQNNMVVRLDGRVVGATPTRVSVNPSRLPVIEVSGPGYGGRECEVQTSIGVGYLVGNTAWCVLVPILGCVSFLVDAISGDWRTLKSGECTVEMGDPVLGARAAEPSRPAPPPPLPAQPPPSTTAPTQATCQSNPDGAVCGYHCLRGATGVWACADRPDGACMVDATGKAVCSGTPPK